MSKKDLKGAIAAERKAIELFPSNYWAYLTLGHAYEALGQTADANDALRQAVQINPKDPACKAALAHLLNQKMAASHSLTTR
jgi:cytochrome c-type biogenesis protein CcmH/NrfG